MSARPLCRRGLRALTLELTLIHINEVMPMRDYTKRKFITPRFDVLELRSLLSLPTVTPNDPYYPQQWGLSNPTNNVDIDAPEAWAISTGGTTPVIVADAGDTGTDATHPDLTNSIWTNPNPNSDPSYPNSLHGWDFGSSSPDVSDSDGHGSNIAGIVAASANNGQGISGVDWNVKFMPLKETSHYGDPNYPNYNFVLDMGNAVHFAVDHGAKVINLSLSYHYNQHVTSAYSKSIRSVLSGYRIR